MIPESSEIGLIKSIVNPSTLTESILAETISVKSNLSKREIRGLTQLGKLIKDHSLMLIESDKNMGLCLIVQEEYQRRVLNELAKLDKSFQVSSLPSQTFGENTINSLIDESTALRDRINNLISKHFNQKSLKCYVTKYLRDVPPPVLPTIRGMPKLHKEGERMRIILPFHQNIFTQIHNFIAAVLTPLAQRVKTALISSLEVIEDLEPLQFPGNYYIVTADLDSMYNRINLKVAVDLILETFRNHGTEFLIFGQNNLTNDSIWSKVIINAFSKCYFLFNDKLIRQTYGVAMGSPAGPLIATLYINCIINKNIAKYPMIKYSRMYIDDGIFIFDSSSHNVMVKQILNDLISFPGSELIWDDKSIHVKQINTLPTDPIIFLDFQISSKRFDDQYKLIFSVYCKPIGSYQYIHNRSCHPSSCKKSIAFAEAIRRLRLSTLETDYEESLNDLRVKLMRRGHKLETINSQIEKAPFSSRNHFLNKTLIKFKEKRNPLSNSNPLKQQRSDKVSHVIPIILRYDPVIVRAIKRAKGGHSDTTE